MYVSRSGVSCLRLRWGRAERFLYYDRDEPGVAWRAIILEAKRGCVSDHILAEGRLQPVAALPFEAQKIADPLT